MIRIKNVLSFLKTGISGFGEPYSIYTLPLATQLLTAIYV